MFAEDLSVFLNADEFGTTVILGGVSVTGILGDAFIENNFVQTVEPVFTYALSDQPSVAIDTTLINGSATYKVKGIEPDGTGLNRLQLEKQ